MQFTIRASLAALVVLYSSAIANAGVVYNLTDIAIKRDDMAKRGTPFEANCGTTSDAT